MPFKVCSFCKHEWPSVEDFERDGRTRPLGLVVDFDDPWETLVLFNHACGSTLALRAEELRARIPCLEAAALLAGEPPCPGRCLRYGDLEPCLNPCRNAPLRNYVVRMVLGRASHEEQSLPVPVPVLVSPPTASSQEEGQPMLKSGGRHVERRAQDPLRR